MRISSVEGQADTNVVYLLTLLTQSVEEDFLRVLVMEVSTSVLPSDIDLLLPLLP